MGGPHKGPQLSQLLKHDQLGGDLRAEPGHTDGTTSPRWPVTALGKYAVSERDQLMEDGYWSRILVSFGIWFSTVRKINMSLYSN